MTNRFYNRIVLIFGCFLICGVFVNTSARMNDLTAIWQILTKGQKAGYFESKRLEPMSGIEPLILIISDCQPEA